jgi:hypothetical protein
MENNEDYTIESVNKILFDIVKEKYFIKNTLNISPMKNVLNKILSLKFLNWSLKVDQLVFLFFQRVAKSSEFNFELFLKNKDDLYHEHV